MQRQKAHRLIEGPRSGIAIFDGAFIEGGRKRCHQQQLASLRLHVLSQALNQLPPDPLTPILSMNCHPSDLKCCGKMGLHRQEANNAAIQDSYPSLACTHGLGACLPPAFVPEVVRERQNNVIAGFSILDSK